MDSAERPYTSRRWTPPPDGDDQAGRFDGETVYNIHDKPSPISLVWFGDKPPEPPPMLVAGLLPQAQIAIAAGVFSSGKTFVIGDLAACVMLGVPFAGHDVLRPGGVLWLAAEGANEVDARIKAAAQARSDEDAPALPFARQAFDVPKLTGPDAEAQLVAHADAFKAGLEERFTGTDLVMIVIDTLGSAAGFIDGNSSAEAQRVMDMLRRVNTRTGALILLVDHFGKAVETGVMGASAKAQSADAVLGILADKTVEGEISNRRMAVAKLRGGAGGAVTPFKLRQVPVGEFGGTTCVVDWQEPVVGTNGAQKPSKSLWNTVAERTFKGCMERALDDHGSEQQPYGRQGPKVKAVHLSKVRSAFVLEYAVDVDDPAKAADAKRNAFKRAREGAMRKGLVQTKQIGASLVDWIWAVKDDRTSTADADDPL